MLDRGGSGGRVDSIDEILRALGVWFSVCFVETWRSWNIWHTLRQCVVDSLRVWLCDCVCSTLFPVCVHVCWVLGADGLRLQIRFAMRLWRASVFLFLLSRSLLAFIISIAVENNYFIRNKFSINCVWEPGPGPIDNRESSVRLVQWNRRLLQCMPMLPFSTFDITSLRFIFCFPAVHAAAAATAAIAMKYLFICSFARVDIVVRAVTLPAGTIRAFHSIHPREKFVISIGNNHCECI